MTGDGIADWEKITENGDRRIDLSGLPDLIAAELAWMAHWQAMDGTRSSVLGTNQFANILRRAIRDNQPFPPSIRAMGPCPPSWCSRSRSVASASEPSGT
ncbi:hypothetical protein I3F60_30665, partial [Streptomyces sp. MUM 136J]|uniref:hypothetical protein n=1 Tax=Streptomyces sp. MUM 136J TaxID=2791992 RepID=UPI001F0393E1